MTFTSVWTLSKKGNLTNTIVWRIQSNLGYFKLWFTLVVKSLQLCPTLCDPMDVACQAPLSMGFSGQEYWSGLSGPSPSLWLDEEFINGIQLQYYCLNNPMDRGS